MVGEWSKAMLRLHNHYCHQLLPFAGGLLDQPNPYLQAMETIDALKS